MFPAVRAIANQRSPAEVDHEIQVFQRQLADQDGHIIQVLDLGFRANATDWFGLHA